MEYFEGHGFEGMFRSRPTKVVEKETRVARLQASDSPDFVRIKEEIDSEENCEDVIV